MKLAVAALALMLLFAGFTASAGYADIYEALFRLSTSTRDLEDTQRARQLSASFALALKEIGYSHDRLRKVSGDEVAALFSAADLAAAFARTADAVEIMRSAMTELERRGLATDAQYQALYGAYVQAGMFAEAARLHRRHGNLLAPLPALEWAGAPKPWVWDPSPTESRLVLSGVDIDEGLRIVVVAHPRCHFSQNAFIAIEKDAQLRELFYRHASLVLPPARSFDLPVVQRWNARHQRLPMRFAFSRSQWPADMSWETPTFYFMKEGELVAKVQGWPREGRRSELIEAAILTGMPVPADAPD